MRRRESWLALAVLAPLSTTAALADVVYVSASAAGANDGSSWNDAFTNFSVALGAAQAGDEIWAAMATYPVPDEAGFIAPAGVSLYGGFVGNETSIDQRLPANRTHLTGYNPVVSPIVLTINDPTRGTVIDGFRFDGTLTSDHDGGGLAVYGGTVAVHNCLFIDNIAGSGAGAFLSSVHATFTDCEFDNNFCQVGDGGGIEAVGTGSLTVSNCHFHDNLARELFGVVGRGGGIFADAGIVLDVRDCLFENNRAYNLGLDLVATGGGIANLSPNAHIENCSFIRNDATLGGAISSEAPITIVNCVMGGNRATEPADSAPFESGQGGAVFGPEGVNLVIKNCTIVANWSKHTAGGLWMDGVVENSILYHNVSLVEPDDDDPEPLVDQQFQGENIEIRYSTVEGMDTPDNDHPGTISANPLFVEAPVLSNPTFLNPTYSPGDLHLQAASPCIDAGDNGAVPADVMTDLDGLPRFVDDPATPDTGLGAPPIVDMGAHEFQPTLRIPGDLTGDGVVGPADLAALLAQWGACDECDSCSGDLSGDCAVGPADLAQLLASWS
jgi:hypothetical protein